MYNTRRIFTHRVEISNLQKVHTRDNKKYTTLNDNKNIHTNSILIRVHKNSYLRKNPRPPLINLVCTFNNVETTNLQHYETGPHRHATAPRHISCVAFMNYARTSATLNSDHAAFSVYALKSEHGEREREP